MMGRIGIFLLAAAVMVVSGALSADQYNQLVWQQLQAHERAAAGSDFDNRNYMMGKLRAGEQADWPVDLHNGRRYLLTGACDDDCSDIDLALIDPSGQVVDEDVLEDDQPVLDLEVDGWRIGGGRYTLRLTMYNCSVQPCYYGIGVFEQLGRGI